MYRGLRGARWCCAFCHFHHAFCVDDAKLGACVIVLDSSATSGAQTGKQLNSYYEVPVENNARNFASRADQLFIICSFVIECRSKTLLHLEDNKKVPLHF